MCFFFRNLKEYSVLFYFLSFAYLYSFCLTHISNARKIKLEDFAEEKENSSFDQKHISEFYFLNENRDTIMLDNLNKPLLIETWNETCPSCIQAMLDIQDEISSMMFLDHVYLYENSRNVNHNQVFSYRHINNSNNILIDINQEFYNEFKMDGYPYFLLFNTKGKLLLSKKGYDPNSASNLLNQLEKKLLN